EDLYKELYSMAKLISDKNLKISTIYIGGGTPTILTAEQLRELILKVHTLFDLNSVKEFTIEAGRPDTITKEKLMAMKEIRTPRISINPQTLNDEVLKVIGRRHTVAQFIESMSLARSLSYNDINVDIIAGLTSDTLESFCNTVDGIYKLAPENITIHSLAIKHSSNLSIENKADYNRNTIADEMIAYADKILDKYQPYYMYKQRNTVNNLENIGYTLPHHECLYNIYMMNEMHTVIGIGASAVTKVVTKKTGKIHRVPSCKLPLEYIKNFDRITKERIDKLYEYDLK
ncbi:MAG: coproporphyrinogen dehydrogenase HemZ, partial [Clostridia bacterium]